MDSQHSHQRMAETWQDPEIAAGVVDRHEACGVILAIATAPEFLMPADWMGLLITHRDPDWPSSAAASEVNDHAISYWNYLDELIRDDRDVPFPPDCEFRDGHVTAALDAFCEGFLRGQEWLESAWEATGLRDDETVTLLLDFAQAALVYLCGNAMIREEMRREHPGFPEDPAEFMTLLPRVFGELGRVGHSLAEMKEEATDSSSF